MYAAEWKSRGTNTYRKINSVTIHTSPARLGTNVGPKVVLVPHTPQACGAPFWRRLDDHRLVILAVVRGLR